MDVIRDIIYIVNAKSFYTVSPGGINEVHFGLRIGCRYGK